MIIIIINITVVCVVMYDSYSKVISWISHHPVIHFYILHLLECNVGFFFKFGTWINEVVLNLHMKHLTGLHWTRSCGATPRPASPNHVMFALPWDIVWQGMVILHRHFRTAYRSQLQETQKRIQNTRKVNWHSHLFWDFIHHLILFRSTMFWKLAVFPFSGKEHLTRWTPSIELFSITGQHRRVSC